MQWSKIQKQYQLRLANKLKGRLKIYVTEYTRSSFDIGRGFILLDGQEVFSVQIPSFYDNNLSFSTETLDFGAAVGEYIKMSAEEALKSTDIILNGLAFFDKKIGKRRLQKIEYNKLYKFSHITYSIRCHIEGIKNDRTISKIA